MQTDATSHNMVACCWGFVANNVASVCMDLLKSLIGFKLYATNANKCQHCCGSMQTDATCWAQQCCVRLHGPLRSVLEGTHSGWTLVWKRPIQSTQCELGHMKYIHIWTSVKNGYEKWSSHIGAVLWQPYSGTECQCCDSETEYSDVTVMWQQWNGWKCSINSPEVLEHKPPIYMRNRRGGFWTSTQCACACKISSLMALKSTVNR